MPLLSHKSFIFFCISLLILLLTLPSSLFAAKRTLSISGLRIYSEEALFNNLKLNRYESGKLSVRDVVDAIEGFYEDQGYTLVMTYVIERTETSLSLFVDEGRLGKIIFYDIGGVELVRMKKDFELKDKIFNIHSLEKNLEIFKKKYEVLSLTYKLKPDEDFDKSRFQLDRELNIPILGKQELPFINSIWHRFNLVIYISTTGKFYRFKQKYGLTIKLKIHGVKGFIPSMGYNSDSLLMDEDHFGVNASSGIMYGIDGNFGQAPRMKYFEAGSSYHLTPTLNNYFTPKIKGALYISKMSREDLGLSVYDYVLLRGTLFPGITILNNLKIYTGVGAERVFYNDSTAEQGITPPTSVYKHSIAYPFLEWQIKLNIIPFSIGRPVTRELKFTFNHYFKEDPFNTTKLLGNYDFEFENRDIYSTDFDTQIVWGSPDHNYEIPISDTEFKGFMGRDYHTRRFICLANEYRVSLYKDFFYAGVFVDLVSFHGSGYDLIGNQFGAVFGFSAWIIVFDQFQSTFYFGWDYLDSTRESQGNIHFKIYQIW
ncbi:MAG: hypothetical protein GY754_18600 [bacterium]|nr:hypothetical protein [bacterium]